MNYIRIRTGNKIKKITYLSFVLIIIIPLALAHAQDASKGPVYIVQSGDTLWSIAQRFRVTMDDLSELNNITNPNQLTAGMELVIPGLEGIEGQLTTNQVSFGESLSSLSRRYRLPRTDIARLNHLVSPMELYVGSYLVLPLMDETPETYQRFSLTPGETLLEHAVLNQTHVWQLILDNHLPGSWSAIAGDILLTQNGADTGPTGLPGVVSSVSISPLPALQGKTNVFLIKGAKGLTIQGSFIGHPLHFFPRENGEYVALQGVHAMTEPGIFPIQLEITTLEGNRYVFSQMVNLRQVDYPYDRPLTVDKATIDPAVTLPEQELWFTLVSEATPDKLWDGVFKIPAPLPQEYCLETGDCWTSRFGNRRSYNGSAYEYFHTGLDVAGGTGTEIYAPAAGVVVFAGPLAIRGNATLINHGRGVYSGYAHQSEIFVKTGDHVSSGQLIGLVGGTGRVEGPHLHWEILVGGVQVDPLDWLSQVYP